VRSKEQNVPSRERALVADMVEGALEINPDLSPSCVRPGHVRHLSSRAWKMSASGSRSACKSTIKNTQIIQRKAKNCRETRVFEWGRVPIICSGPPNMRQEPCTMFRVRSSRPGSCEGDSVSHTRARTCARDAHNMRYVSYIHGTPSVNQVRTSLQTHACFQPWMSHSWPSYDFSPCPLRLISPLSPAGHTDHACMLTQHLHGST